MKRLTPLAVLCALFACGKKTDNAPWLTTPDLPTHSALYFPIDSGDVHGPAAGQQPACNQCHADRSSGAPPYPPAASFQTFTCTGCHVEVRPGVYHDDITQLATLHAGAATFDPTQPLAYDRVCFGCHGSGASAPPYHGELFPIDSASKHAGIGCSSCHGPKRADLTQLQCASCHAANFATQHAPVNGIAILVVLTPPPASCTPSPLPPPQSPDCLKCHALSHVDHVELPAVHPTGDTAFGKGPHKAAGCFTCHVVPTQITATVTPPTPAPSGYPAVDFTQPRGASQSSPGCATCHGSSCGNGN